MTNIAYARRFAIAPMLNWTDRHCRYFHRLITREALLYTEMLTMNAIRQGGECYLRYNEEEHPVALQIGGSDPKVLSYCARLAEKYGYDEVNLNVGCPSNRVKSGRFGACLMSNAALVSDCVKAMSDVVSIPVTVKTRIGIDNDDSYEFLSSFIDVVSRDSGCRVFIIHARKAILSGLTPKENRDIPNLDYSRVYRLKQDFPMLKLIANGGISSLGEAKIHLHYLDGVMMGRSAYCTPGILMEIDREIFGLDIPRPNPVKLVDSMCNYAERELSKGTPLGSITRHMLGLFHGSPGARHWRRYLSQEVHRPSAGTSTLESALMLVLNIKR